AVLYRYRTGIPWRDWPVHFGSWKSTHKRFSRWCKSGVFDRVLNHLAGDADAEYVMIDATIIRAYQHSAGARKKGRGPGHRTVPGRSDKQNPCTRRRLGQSGQAYSDRGSRPRSSRCGATARRRRLRRAARRQRLRCRRPDRTAARRENRRRHSAKEQSQRQRECDFILYKERNLIERLFGKLKQFRAIATRYDKLARNFLGAIRLVAAVIQLN